MVEEVSGSLLSPSHCYSGFRASFIIIIIIAMWLLMARLFYEKTVVDVIQLIYHS